MSEALGDLTERLEQAAEHLRGGDLEPDAAARLVEECAELAARAAAALDRESRAVADPAPGQAALEL